MYWIEFLRSIADRGLRCVKRVVYYDRKGFRASARRALKATHQRKRALVHVSRGRHGAIR